MDELIKKLKSRIAANFRPIIGGRNEGQLLADKRHLKELEEAQKQMWERAKNDKPLIFGDCIRLEDVRDILGVEDAKKAD